MFWVDHPCEADDQSHDDGAIFAFLKEDFLHWIEGLSFIYRLSDGVLLLLLVLV